MNSTTFGILSFIIDIAKRDAYQSLVFLSSSNSSWTFDDSALSLIEHVSKATTIPIISQTFTSPINIGTNFNTEVLTVVDLKTNLYLEILAKVRQVFYYTTHTRIVLVLDHDGPNPKFLQGLFKLCWKKKLLNVVAIFRDFVRTNEVYGYIPYPTLHIEKRRYSSDTIFPDRLKDLKGTHLRVFADQIAPHSMMTIKKTGEIYLMGYASHIINSFTKKHNAKYDFPVPYEIGKSVYSPDLKKLLYNDTIDLLVSLTIINSSGVAHSYPVEQTSYCLMLPVEKDLQTALFYAVILDPTTIIVNYAVCCILSAFLVLVTYHMDKRKKLHFIDIFLNVSVMRGIYGLAVYIPKRQPSILLLIYFLLSILGMHLSTWYVAYLQTYFTHPPTQRKVKDLADLHWAGYKIFFFWRENYETLDMIKQLLDESVLHVTQDFSEYLKVVDNLNTKFAYMVPTAKWNIFKEQQKLFSRPLFRTSNMCAVTGIQMGFPIHPNSVFKDALNRVILQAKDAGMLKYWRDRTFPELVRIGRMSYTDWSYPRKRFRPLKAQDLWFVCTMASGYLLGAVVALIGEFIFDKVQRMLKRRKLGIIARRQNK